MAASDSDSKGNENPWVLDHAENAEIDSPDASLLDRDSGYGGSLPPMSASGHSDDQSFDYKNITPDLVTDSTGDGLRRTPSQQLQSTAHMNQEEYNNNRVALGRTISSVEDILHKLGEVSKDHQIYFPDQKSSVTETDSDNGLPVTDFHVLKLDLKVGHTGQEYSHKLENSSLTKLLQNRIVQVQKHLKSLLERINDTSSKVLITGDVNSGKSTFCNALLGRKILPVDQQPCTNVFCEVHDCRDNFGKEQVHAVPMGSVYNRLDARTYEVHPLSALDDLVWEQDKYILLKVYVDEKRPSDQSLLRNGVADIALIDAPGLNRDSYQTTQLFSRQEEIDLVVFVVSAENHFTLSAKEFIGAAAHEKSLIYIVVNRFDAIRDKKRCKRRILDQVAELSPETHKDARDFVHFVGEDAAGPSEGPSNDGASGSGSGGSGGGDDPSDPSDNNFLDDRFKHLEVSLRSFVLEKRSISKLAPAKTYLNNLLIDLERLARVNIISADKERENYESSLGKITPVLREVSRNRVIASDKVESMIEKTSQKIFEHTTNTVNGAIKDTSQPATVEYTSIFHARTYAEQCQAAIIERIRDSVTRSEEYAFEQTVSCSQKIFDLGLSYLGEDGHPEFKNKLSRAMFERNLDNAIRDVDSDVSITDFLSFDSILPTSIPSWITKIFQFDTYAKGLLPASNSETTKSVELASMNSALTLVSVVGGGKMILNSGVVRHFINAVEILNTDTAKKLAIPAILGVAGFGVYKVVNDMPRTISKNMSLKVAKQVEEQGYVYKNSKRISKRSRRVLREPAEIVREAFQREEDNKSEKHDKICRSLDECDVIHEYFSLLLRDAASQRRHVAKCQLEVPSQV